MRNSFLLTIAVFVTSLTLAGCSGSSGSSSRYQPKQWTQEDKDKLAREGGYRDHDDMMRKLEQRESGSGSSSSSSSQSSSTQSLSGTITLDLSEEDRRELLGEEDDAGVSSSGGAGESYSSSPGGSTRGDYTYSSPPNTYSSPSYGSSTMGGYASGVESRIGQQRSADSIQRDEEARRLNAIRNGP